MKNTIPYGFSVFFCKNFSPTLSGTYILHLYPQHSKHTSLQTHIHGEICWWTKTLAPVEMCNINIKPWFKCFYSLVLAGAGLLPRIPMTIHKSSTGMFILDENGLPSNQIVLNFQKSNAAKHPWTTTTTTTRFTQFTPQTSIQPLHTTRHPKHGSVWGVWKLSTSHIAKVPSMTASNVCLNGPVVCWLVGPKPDVSGCLTVW